MKSNRIKRIAAFFLTAVLVLGGFVQKPVFAASYYGTVYQGHNTISIVKGTERTWRFVPEVSGYYSFYTWSGVDTEGYLYTPSNTWHSQDATGPNYDEMFLYAWLEAGTECSVGVFIQNRTANASSATVTLHITRRMTDGVNEVELDGQDTHFDILTHGSTANYGYYEVFTLGSQDTVGTVDNQYTDDDSGVGNNFYVKYLRKIYGGTISVSARLYNGTSKQRVQLVALPIYEQKRFQDDIYNVDTAYNTDGFRSISTFIPEEDGTYVFTCKSDYDTDAFLYDENWNLLTSDDDGGPSKNYKLYYDLTAGTRYYFESRMKGDVTYSCTFADQVISKKVFLGDNPIKIRKPTMYERGKAWRFIAPVTGNYRFQITSGASANYGMVVDSNYVKLDPEESSMTGFDTVHTYKLTGGKAYYVEVHNDSETPVDSNLRIQANIKQAKITLSKTSYVADGTARKPGATVIYDGETLKRKTDYTISYKNNIKAGTATATVKGMGRFYASVEKKFTIAGKDLTKGSVKLSKTSYVYNGKARKPTATVTYDGKKLTKDTDYTVSYKNNKNVGKATVTISGKGKYGGTLKKTFKITAKSIASATVSGIKAKTYTGKAIKQSPKLTVGSLSLVSGTDYSITYSNNTKAGTAKMTLTGKGNFKDSLKKTFKIKKKALSNTTITLSYTSAKENGKARKPAVTVKIGSTALKKGTDYTVSYKNNKLLGTAKAVVKGTGSVTGEVTKTFKITRNTINWGKDNWSFTNSPNSFVNASGGSRTTYREQINSSYLNKLGNNLTNSEYQVIFEGYTNSSGVRQPAWLDDEWSGSCYGMSALTSLANLGKLPYTDYYSGATYLNQLPSPVNNFSVSSLITYYQMLQIRSVIQQQYRTVPYNSQETNLKKIVSELKKHSTVLVGFKGSFGGHAILAYGYASGSWTWNGKNYDQVIKIDDPNYATSNLESAYIYYRTSDYSWIIPKYIGSSWGGSGSDDGWVFNYIGGDLSDLNDGGYLSGATTMSKNDYVARLDAYTYGEGFGIAKASLNRGEYTINTAAGSDDIKEGWIYMMAGSRKGTFGYNLFDADSAYEIHQKADDLQTTMFYKDTMAAVSGSKAEKAYFDKDYVSVAGQKGSYRLGLTLNKDYPTSWFNIEAEVHASGASLRKTSEGYILKSDDLKDFTVYANNKEVKISQNFSAKGGAVLIYEIDENTIGMREVIDSKAVFEPNAR